MEDSVITAPADVSDADFRFIAESLPHIVWMARPDGSIEYFNRQGTTYTGYQAEVLYGWKWLSLVHPDDVDRAMQAWEVAIRTEEPYSLDSRVRRFDGKYRWHTFRGVPIRDDFGFVVKWIGTVTDIDDAVRSAAELQLAEREMAETLTMLETLQSKAPLGFGFVDRDFRIVRLNERLAAIHGSTVAEQLGETVADVIPELWPHLEPLYRQVLDTGEAVLDVEVDSPSAADPRPTRHWLASYYPVALDAEVIGIGVIVVDITERKAVEATRQQLSAIIDGSGDAIFGATIDGTITSWNGAAERLFGYTAEETIGQPVALIAFATQVDEQAQMRARLIAGGSHEHLETTRRRKDGSQVEVLITASTTTDEAGKVVGLSVIAHDITQRRAQQRAGEASQRQLAEAQCIAHLGSFEFELLTGELTWSEEQYRILGLDRALTPTADLFFAVVHPDDLPVVHRVWADALERGLPFDHECRIIRGDSEERVVRTRGIAEVALDGTIVKIAGTMMDDTERIEADRVRRAAETRFEIGFEQTGIGVGILDLDVIPIRLNTAACTILGRPEDLLVGRRWAEYSHPDDLPLGPAVLARVAAGHDTYTGERRYLRPDGSVVWTSLHITLVRDEAREPQYYLAQLLDISERKQMENDLAHQALHDSLTGLPSRALLTDRLFQGLAGSRRRGSQLGVMFLDVDNFKVVNDSLGHTYGDDLLRHAADRISGAIRPGDTVARFGGDEFVVVCDDVSAVEIEQIAERVLEALSQPWHMGNQKMTVTASLGIAVADDDATPESLLRDSDAAMYRAKQRGRGRIELYDEALRSKAARRLATASALHRALEREEFMVHYQPVIDLTTGEMVSAEALLRWQHPTRGLVSPIEFIPLAEESGLIVPIGAWLLEHACADVVEWQRVQGSPPMAANLSVAVNVSVRQLLATDIVELIEGVLVRTGLGAGDLCLELTESVFMEDVDYFGTTLDRLKSLGIRLAIDDFGTGYSSLNYLKRFPFDAVKVDQAFVDGLGTDPHDTALVAAIVAMARALGLEVTAEGVETEEQLIELKQLQVPLAQGFYLAKPMPAEAISRLVARSHRWAVGP